MFADSVCSNYTKWSCTKRITHLANDSQLAVGAVEEAESARVAEPALVGGGSLTEAPGLLEKSLE